MPGPDLAPHHEPEDVARIAEENARGAAWMLSSTLWATAMTLAVRYGSSEVTSHVLLVLRSIGALALCGLALLFMSKLRGDLRFTAPWRHVWRGALIGVSTVLGFYTLTHLPLTTATVLFFTAPIFTTLLAMAIQGERVGPRRAGAIAVGFLGVLIVLRPGLGFEPTMLAALTSSLTLALALIASRGLAVRDGSFSAYVSSVVMTLIIGVPLAAQDWSLPQSGDVWVAIVVVVITSIARGLADIQAYRWAQAAVLAPISYLRLITIALGAYALFGETPDVWTAIGGAVIVGAALYIAHRERLTRRR